MKRVRGTTRAVNQFSREDLELLFNETDEVGRELARGQVHRNLVG